MIPIIPGVTDTRENLESLVGILRAAGVKTVKLLPYNPLGTSIEEALGRTRCAVPPTFMHPNELGRCTPCSPKSSRAPRQPQRREDRAMIQMDIPQRSSVRMVFAYSARERLKTEPVSWTGSRHSHRHPLRSSRDWRLRALPVLRLARVGNDVLGSRRPHGHGEFWQPLAGPRRAALPPGPRCLCDGGLRAGASLDCLGSSPAGSHLDLGGGGRVARDGAHHALGADADWPTIRTTTPT